MELGELLRASGVAAELRGDASVEIGDLAYDSGRVGPGTLFFCFAGERTDGHDFAAGAVEAGAAALIVERPLDLDVPQAQVEDARAAMAPIAAIFNGDPTSELTVVGITGTNGKTTTAFLVRHLLEAAGRRCGLLGTVRQVVGGRIEEVERTTPEAIDLQRTFERMLEAGDDACAMEVSSHALVLHRADAIHLAVKVFTNLSQDHLDFHADMEDYFAAKRLLFSGEGGAPLIELEGGISVINLDDGYGQRLAAELSCGSGGECITYSAAGGAADLSARGVTFDASGSRFICLSPDGQLDVQTPLPGDFNVANALAALSVAHALGLDLGDSAAALASADQVPGRFESIDEGQPFAVIVDYAHTPDSLENVLEAARRLTGRRLISVFGCGGDRDRDKRPQMGRAGAELSDVAVVTSDNPRSEDPAAIIEQIRAGIPENRHAEVVVERDRRAAIALAVAQAGDGDTVVIAGKGHEQGQEFENGRKIPFDDRDVAREELRRLRRTIASSRAPR
ncbi:MAG TPA: UDP-N-acetylmuramoyl-L-alanyl-D-glutamate--2,6-diaminopimelate ligase [Solirubrobacterales bacterium]|nr:UDP-N-acetylmuramoyl-L-alanyl-D-glutamate--2,6-diaminopimelate ligase [Solirubrobacterales bacterium]